MQHLRGRIAKSDVRTYASSTVSRHFGAETKMYGDVGIAASKKTSRDDGMKQFSIQHPTYYKLKVASFLIIHVKICKMGLYTNCFMPSSLLVFLLFAVLLSLHMHTFILFFTLVLIYNVHVGLKYTHMYPTYYILTNATEGEGVYEPYFPPSG